MSEVVEIDLSYIGLIDSEEASSLVQAGIPVTTKQRKTYDEYYVIESRVSAKVTLTALMKLTESFKVQITPDGVSIMQSSLYGH